MKFKVGDFRVWESPAPVHSQKSKWPTRKPPCPCSEAGSYLRLIDSGISLRLKDLLGPVTSVKKKKNKKSIPVQVSVLKLESLGFRG